MQQVPRNARNNMPALAGPAMKGEYDTPAIEKD